jgi:hypothetical protein
VKNGSFDLFTATECVVAQEAQTVAQAMRAVGLTAEEARALGAALRKDWGFTDGGS